MANLERVRQFIPEKFQGFRAKREEKKVVLQLADETSAKLLSDLATGGYTLLRGWGESDFSDYHQKIINQTVILNDGKQDYHVGLSNSESWSRGGTLNANSLWLKAHDNLLLPDLPSGVSRHLSYSRDRYVDTLKKGKVKIDDRSPRAPHAFKVRKYDYMSPESQPDEHGRRLAADSPEMSMGEVVDFCWDLLKAEINEEATREAYHKTLIAFEKDTHSDLLDSYWSKDRHTTFTLNFK